MLDKRNLHIFKYMWAIVNHPVSVPRILKLNICLTEGALLDATEHRAGMICKEIMENLLDISKMHFTLGHVFEAMCFTSKTKHMASTIF